MQLTEQYSCFTSSCCHLCQWLRVTLLGVQLTRLCD